MLNFPKYFSKLKNPWVLWGIIRPLEIPLFLCVYVAILGGNFVYYLGKFNILPILNITKYVGLNINSSDLTTQRTGLHWAAIKNKENIYTRLIQYGADPLKWDKQGAAPKGTFKDGIENKERLNIFLKTTPLHSNQSNFLDAFTQTQEMIKKVKYIYFENNFFSF